MRMKKWLKRFLCLLGAALFLLAAGAFAKVKLWGRPSGERQADPPRVELTWAEAMADGRIFDEEIAVHYAPDILAAVNVLLSDSGRGDYLAAADFDGDMKGLNNWEHMPDYPLQAVVYHSAAPRSAAMANPRRRQPRICGAGQRDLVHHEAHLGAHQDGDQRVRRDAALLPAHIHHVLPPQRHG